MSLSEHTPLTFSQSMFHQAYSCLGFPILKQYLSSMTTLILDAIPHSQRVLDVACLSNPLFYLPRWRQKWCVYLSISIREDIPILVKECTHSYKRNVPKIPLNQGLDKAPSWLGTLFHQLFRWRWWDNQLLEELLTMSWTSFRYSGVFMFWDSFVEHRPSITFIHEFSHVIIPPSVPISPSFMPCCLIHTMFP